MTADLPFSGLAGPADARGLHALVEVGVLERLTIDAALVHELDRSSALALELARKAGARRRSAFLYGYQAVLDVARAALAACGFRLAAGVEGTSIRAALVGTLAFTFGLEQHGRQELGQLGALRERLDLDPELDPGVAEVAAVTRYAEMLRLGLQRALARR